MTGDHDDSIETVYLRNGRATVSRTNGTLADIAPLLARTDLPKLRHLAITKTLFTDELVASLVKAPIVHGLDTLRGQMMGSRGCTSRRASARFREP